MPIRTRAVPALLSAALLLGAQTRPLPGHIPPKRTAQIKNGFGINSDLPREPWLPWDRWWWTRMFDAGVSWIRIGQYENSSEPTSWDWVEQKRGVYAIAPEVDDYVDSLVENGVQVQVQLLYGNPMYTSPAGRKPDSITPEPGSFHNDDRGINSVFYAPKTPEQIEAFVRYVKWTVNHFRGRIRYYALWNEQDIGYWNPWGNPEEYGHLLAAFAPAVHEADPQAKVIYGGLADPSASFARRSLDACHCASQIDVFAYHTYPGYGRNLNPETMDSGAYGKDSPAKLRQTVLAYPAIKKDIPFWDDEFNSIPSWTGSDESVQAKYIPRGMIYNLAAGVRTFVWLLAAGVDGNEYDDFGLIHGLRNMPDDFTPRPVFQALQNTNALFSDVQRDQSIVIEASNHPAGLLTYGFRSAGGKAIVAWWLAVHSSPGNRFKALTTGLKLTGAGIQTPVLVDVVSGAISPLHWKPGAPGTLEAVPVRDSIMAVVDATYFDWPVLPETPSGLNASRDGSAVALKWVLHGDSPNTAVERRAGSTGPWQRIATPGPVSAFTDSGAPLGALVCYRVRAINANGESAFSNIVRVP
jgi:hypothetical protein